MTTHVENLEVGDWITIVKDRLEGEEDAINFFGMPTGRKTQPSYSGKPCQVVGISLPFLALRTGNEVMGLDIRRYEVQRLSLEYVRAFIPKLEVGLDNCQKCGRKLRIAAETRQCEECDMPKCVNLWGTITSSPME